MEYQDNRWERYAESAQDSPPSRLLVQALDYVRQRNEALEMGAGAGTDVVLLVNEGFHHVVALDQEPLAQKTLAKLPQNKVDYVISTFEEYLFPQDRFDLISAQAALPFANSSSLSQVIAKIKQALKSGGVFTADFFGPNHSWNQEGADIVFMTSDQVRELFSDMEIIALEERERDGESHAGGPTHWHIINLIARKK